MNQCMCEVCRQSIQGSTTAKDIIAYIACMAIWAVLMGSFVGLYLKAVHKMMNDDK